MKKALTKKESKLYHYACGKKVVGPNPDMWGDCTGLWGDCSGLWGDCSGLSGNCTGISGNCSRLFGDCTGLSGDCSRLFGDCSGISGNCTGISGDLDSCDISPDERADMINIDSLIAPLTTEEPKND